MAFAAKLNARSMVLRNVLLRNAMVQSLAPATTFLSHNTSARKSSTQNEQLRLHISKPLRNIFMFAKKVGKPHPTQCSTIHQVIVLSKLTVFRILTSNTPLVTTPFAS